jgi:hypothetical protein
LGDYKLLVGPQKQASWFGAFSPNASFNEPAAKEAAATTHSPPARCPARQPQRRGPLAFEKTACVDAPCLFDIRSDPTEHNDLAQAMPAKVEAMMQRFSRLENEAHPHPPSGDDRSWPRQNDTLREFCAAAEARQRIMGPWRLVPILEGA